MRHLYLILGLLISTIAFSQQVKLYGTITNNKGVALAGASATVKENGAQTQTDSLGHYQFMLDSGTYTIEVTYPGMVTKSSTATFRSDMQLDLTLEAAPTQPTPTETKTITPSAGEYRIYGTITDEKDNSPVVGATVLVKGTTNGVQSDIDGKYELKVGIGLHTLEFSYIGYGKRSIPVSITMLEKEKKVDVKMGEEVKNIDIVVVTGSKYEKKLSEETVSMEVLKASVINQNSARMEEAINKVPGVNMLGKTISIRGGSGFSDATGNRVLALLDEMPIISPENGSIRWETVAIEALEQVEVIKGSASAMYGSSALNGVLNMRTINPKPEMVNKILINYGFYGQPYQHTWNWWWNRKVIKHNGDTINRVQHPMFGGGTFLHAKQYGDFGIVLAASYNQNQGFRQNNDYKQARLSAKLRYTPHKLANLTVGLNMNFFHETLKDFFLGSGTATYIYIPTEVVLTRTRTFNIDPYLNYYDKKENRHSIKFRIYNTFYNSNAGVASGGNGDSTSATQFMFDYTFLKKFNKINLVVITGVSGSYSTIHGKTFGDLSSAYFNTRSVNNAATFIQLEKKFWKRLTIAGGARFEYAFLDTSLVRYPFYMISKWAGKDSAHQITSPIAPIFRIGLNVQATEGTFIRASFGQGFRYPSLAEKFVHTVRSGVEVFPNKNLQPETGWSAEVGIKQGLKISKWMAYFDVSGYIMQYRNMIEFQAFTPDSGITFTGIPFHAINVEHARVMGVEVSAIANGQIFGVPLNFLIGYSYLDPENLDYNPNDVNSVKLLKYRIQHSAKADIQTNYKGFTVGLSAFFNSFMKNIDQGSVGNLNIVKEFRRKHSKGDFVMDVRAGYSYKEKATFMFICKNVLNREYMLRPGLIEAPRSFTFQVGYNF